MQARAHDPPAMERESPRTYQKSDEDQNRPRYEYTQHHVLNIWTQLYCAVAQETDYPVGIIPIADAIGWAEFAWKIRTKGFAMVTSSCQSMPLCILRSIHFISQERTLATTRESSLSEVRSIATSSTEFGNQKKRHDLRMHRDTTLTLDKAGVQDAHPEHAKLALIPRGSHFPCPLQVSKF